MSRARRSHITIVRPGNPDLYLPPAGMPSGWEVIGTVTTAEGTGALVRRKSNGIYARANTDAIRSLPQRKVQQAIEVGEADDLPSAQS